MLLKILEPLKLLGTRAAGVHRVGRLDDVRVLQAHAVQAHDARGEPADAISHYWFEIVETGADGRAWHGFRVVRLAELTFLPREVRADPALARKQAALVRGLCAAGVETVTLGFGIFDPPIGIVQCYGVAARDTTLAEAERRAASADAALHAAFAAQFPQSRLAPLSVGRAQWLWDALHRMPHATALVGQPDPRDRARVGDPKGPLSGRRPVEGPEEQQNELLFRGMARAREEFLFVNIATPVPRRELARQLAALADLASPIASRQQGVTSIGLGIALPVILTAGEGQSAGRAYGTADAEGVSDSTSNLRGTAHTEGQAQTSGWAVTRGESETEGIARTESVAHSSGTVRSTTITEGISHTDSAAQTHAVASTVGASQSRGVGGFESQSAGESHAVSQGASVGLGVPISGQIGLSGGIPAETLTGRLSGSVGITPSVGASMGVTDATSWASAAGTSFQDTSSVMQATTESTATTVGQSDTVSRGVGQSQGAFESTTVGSAVTTSLARTRSEATTVSGATTRSAADTVSEATGTAHGVSRSHGVTLGRSLGASRLAGLGAGVAPSASVAKTFQWKDEAAVALTALLEQQLDLLGEAAEEGAVYSDSYLLARTENGRHAAEAAAVVAFGGAERVVTHVQVRRPAGEAEADHLRQHARCLSPSTLVESLGWINGYAYSTLLTPAQQAAYTAPGLFEEGTALTVQERTPPFAFRPDLPGDAVLGHLYSTERGELTSARLALSEARHFHTLFAADTGFGKTVAAERLAIEAVGRWRHRAVVLDFGAGWRRMLSAPLPPERVDLYQLYPGAVRPFRWNFLQVGQRVPPDRQLLATAELLANAGRMGPRQLGFLRRALRQLYVEHGALTADPEVVAHPWWGVLHADEQHPVERARAERGGKTAYAAGASLADLQPWARQALSVHRSKRVDVRRLYERLNQFLAKLPKGEQASRTSLEGVLLRLEPFTQGELGLMYGGGEGSLAVEDLGLLGPEPEPAERWGLCVLEGGAEMDDYSKSVVLSLVAWHLYNDSVIRRRETIGGFNRPLDLFFEEANKILGGAAETATSEAGTTSPVAGTELWQAMWRDGRKYRIFLHPLVQTLSELPPGIQASCNNAFLGQMKNLRDRDLAVGHLARSERGFTDEEYKRYLGRMPRGLAVVKFGYGDDVADLEPMLARPVRVPGLEPTDAEILERFTR